MWLRSPNSDNSNNALYVNTDGNVNNDNVNNSLGVRPALPTARNARVSTRRPRREGKERRSRPNANHCGWRGQTHTVGKGMAGDAIHTGAPEPCYTAPAAAAI